MHLLDTNLILELLLDQDGADDVRQLLRSGPTGGLHLSEFSLYSIGLILVRRRMQDVLTQFVDDLLLSGTVGLVRLGPADLATVAYVTRRFNLDFDDAYQYVAASGTTSSW